MGATPMESRGQDDLAREILKASRLTMESIDRLAKSVEAKREETQAEIAEVRKEIAAIRVTLVGKQGDNGLTSRVMLLERQQGHVTWQSVGVLVALAMTVIGLIVGAFS